MTTAMTTVLLSPNHVAAKQLNVVDAVQADVATGDLLLESTLLSQHRRRRRSYRPPADSRIPRRDHSGGGVRGCGEDIAAIAPRLSGIGQTVSTHPTLVWYTASDIPSALELHLYRYTADDRLETVFIKSIGDSQKGYMAYTLPEDELGLQPGETYLWQVVLFCDENREEVGMWTAADIELAPSAVAVEPSMIDPSQDSLSIAETYANLGIWYDALAQVYDATSVEEKEFLQTLLLDLAELEESVERKEDS